MLSAKKGDIGIEIIAIPALQDNYIWLLQSGHHVIVVDPSESQPVEEYIDHHGLDLSAIWLTHGHHDHIGGVAALKKRYPSCLVYGVKNFCPVDIEVSEGYVIHIGEFHAVVWHIPGHTENHVAYLLQCQDQEHVFCGDTLFSGGCGRVFTGTIQQLFSSLQRLNALPKHTLFYPAHEYTLANLKFAQEVEPDNQAIQVALEKAATNRLTLPVCLQDEQKINPFLRIYEPAIRQRLYNSGRIAQNSDDLALFAALREWKNHF